MGDSTSNVVNLDLNLGPGPEVDSVSVQSEQVTLEEFVANAEPIDSINEAFGIRAFEHWQLPQFQLQNRARAMSLELNRIIGSTINVSTLLPGEASAAAEERASELNKTCENNSGFVEGNVLTKRDDIKKGDGRCGSFFDCNICLELASDPVVTSCGHLFCWACLYQWLNTDSGLRDCPVCKEEVTLKNVTPVYGRGNNSPKDLNPHIPGRPQAKRVESFRQAIYRNPFSFPLEEIIQRIGSRFYRARDFDLFQESNAAHETVDRTSSFPNTIISLGGLQADQNPSEPPDDVADLTHSGTSSPEATPARRLRSLLLRRAHSHVQRPSTQTSTPSSSSPSERLMEAFLGNHPTGRNQEQPQPHDDRDSFSSIAAVISPESQVDTAVEIDSLGGLSGPSSRRRNDSMRAFDVDSGESRLSRRRRLN